MAEKLVQHRHCQMCLKATPLDEEYCNDECKEKWTNLRKMERKRKIINWIYIWILVMVLLFVVWPR